jgi:hypothetical protein
MLCVVFVLTNQFNTMEKIMKITKRMTSVVSVIICLLGLVPSAIAQEFNLPGANFLGEDGPFISCKIFGCIWGTGFHDHTVSYWDVADVVQGSPNGGSNTAYLGPINYQVRRYSPSANLYDTGTETVTPNGRIRVAANKMESGAIYWLCGEVDGEIFVAKPFESFSETTAHVSATMMWGWGTHGTSRCPVECLENDPSWYGGESQYYGGPPIWSPSQMRIFLPAPATVRSGLSNIPIHYIELNDFLTNSIQAKKSKLTDSAGNAIFNI